MWVGVKPHPIKLNKRFNMAILDIVTVNDYKQQFPRFVPVYLPVYKENTTYFKNDVVYYSGLFYICIKDSTTALPTVEADWTLYNTTVYNYTRDEDITNAMQEASINFNEGLFSDEATKKLVFLYLVAYYLTVDFNNATGGAYKGITSSKSVGSVSESYALPRWMTDSPLLSMYCTNGYGLKYLSLIRPYLIGNIYLAKGATTVD